MTGSHFVKRCKLKRFRGVKMKLKCGHEKVEVTSFYRLPWSRVLCIYVSFQAKGVFCGECKAVCRPIELIGTVQC